MMKGMKLDKRKLNNQGISLVEVLVAIVILGIIVAPLLRAFVISANTNMKAKEKLKATTVAQNLAEGMNSLSLEDIIYQFNYPTADVNAGYAGFTLAPVSNTTTCELLEKTDASTGTTYFQKALNKNSIPEEVTNKEDMMTCSLDLEGNLKTSADHKYYLWAENISGYNALVTIDGHPSDAFYASVNEDGNKVILNKIDSSSDAVSMNVDLPIDVLNDLKSHTYYKSGSTELQQSDIARRIYLDIKQNASGKVVVTATYRYYFTTDRDGSVTYPAVGSADELNYSQVIFDNTVDTSLELNDIYLFFSPWYTSTSTNVLATPIEGSNYMDGIIINNSSDLNLDVYLVKQNEESTNEKEEYYKTFVSVIESDYTTSSAISIHTNLNNNLAGIGDASSQATFLYGSQPSNLNCTTKYVYTDASGNVMKDADNNEITNTGLIDHGEQDNLYEITIAIYKKSVRIQDLKDADTQPVASLSGGFLD